MAVDRGEYRFATHVDLVVAISILYGDAQYLAGNLIPVSGRLDEPKCPPGQSPCHTFCFGPLCMSDNPARDCRPSARIINISIERTGTLARTPLRRNAGECQSGWNLRCIGRTRDLGTLLARTKKTLSADAPQPVRLLSPCALVVRLARRYACNIDRSGELSRTLLSSSVVSIHGSHPYRVLLARFAKR